MSNTVAVIIIVLALTDLVGVAVVVAMFRASQRERSEWAAERRVLIDRAIARHTGEVIALDRTATLTPKPHEPERLIEGLT